jgi:4-hydroxymandelate oxidase
MSYRTTRREALLSGLGVAAASLGPKAAASAQTQSHPDALPRYERAVSLMDFETLAQSMVLPSVYDRVAGGAGSENTLRWNREALDRIRLKPRVLRDVSKLDTRIKLFGQELSFPILLAPTGGHALVNPEGEMATARGAAAAGATLAISIGASFPIQDIAKAAKGPLWLQCYIQKDRGLTRDLLEKGQAAGYKAFCVTLDNPVLGARDREEKAMMDLPTRERPNGMAPARSNLTQPGAPYSPLEPDKLTWDSVDWLLSFARIPVVLKGVLNPDDAERAARSGVAGIIVSNHGGRQLDTVPPTIEVLPSVVEKVAGRIPVLVDGGIRRGVDVLKGLALGASAVLIGRPYLYGLALGGADGVKRVVDILRTEFELAMALTGRASISEIDRTVLWNA